MRARLRSRKVILIQLVQLLQDSLHRLWSLEREEGIDTLLIEVVRERPQEEPCEGTSESMRIGVALAVLEAPGSKVGGGEIMRKEAVAPSKGNGVAEDGPADGVSRAETGTVNEGLRLLGLQTDVELEVVDVAIQKLSGSGNLWVRVPFKEGAECCEDMSGSRCKTRGR